jgi:exodeoxyribonuclease VII large subunit
MQHNEAIWSVSALNFEIKTMLEQGIGSIWIEGEISNFSKPASGHWYFTLKDERSQLRAAMFRNRNQRIPFTPQNGQQILIRAQVTLYEARGDYQVIVEHMEEAGVGRLMREFEALKKQLSKEGLFDQKHKKPIPDQARHIGIITSASGAAIRDAISVIRRRSPSSQVTLFPTQVQGEAATGSIVKAIQLANRHAECDVILLIRGGGSLEDLWCFNEAAVAHAIFDSEIPIVSGIGHEIDTTIADYVADQRAPTPSVAAESVTMDQYEIMMRIDQLSLRLQQYMVKRLSSHEESINTLQQRLMRLHPQRQMQSLKQRLEFARSTLRHIQNSQLERKNHKLQRLIEQIRLHQPQQKISILKLNVERCREALSTQMKNQLIQQRHELALNSSKLDNLSPLKTLARGYATVSLQNKLIHSASELQINDEIKLRFIDGEHNATIK